MINIAIDGPSAAGKSSISDILANKLGYIHLDTGAMYRVLALHALNNNVSFDDEEKLVEILSELNMVFKDDKILLNGLDVSNKIRENNISLGASSVSKHKKIREMLVCKQQEISKGKGYILDGRDIGTVVLKDAEVKIFLTATSKCRAQRRIDQYKQDGKTYDYQTILNDIEARDLQDSTRTNSPLKPADDALIIDTSNYTIEEVVNLIIEQVNKHTV